ncbi:MAG: intradiol ring-cleavage dioxygenase [Gammaproteobacteria bacterium]
MHTDLTRRRIIAASASLLATPALMPLAGAALMTPQQALGPFYPSALPPDHDNDLATVAGHEGIAAGDITHVIGQVTAVDDKPIAKAIVEIWQVNAFGRYHHPRDRRDRRVDPNFQGYGHVLTDADGKYSFRTIRPVPYPGRTPHIHFAVTRPGGEPLITQMYVDGEPGNERDGLLNSVRNDEQRRRLIVPLERSKAYKNELLGKFDIVLPI